MESTGESKETLEQLLAQKQKRYEERHNKYSCSSRYKKKKNRKEKRRNAKNATEPVDPANPNTELANPNTELANPVTEPANPVTEPANPVTESKSEDELDVALGSILNHLPDVKPVTESKTDTDVKPAIDLVAESTYKSKPKPIRGLSPDELKAEVDRVKSTYVEEKVMVTIEKIASVVKHPNADELWIARVQGYNVVFNPRSMFTNPDGTPIDPAECKDKLIVYFNIDSVMPDVFAEQGFWKYLTSTYMGRKVTTAKLRGVVSQGMIETFDTIKKLFPDLQLEGLPEGHNLTNALKVMKYYAATDAEGPFYNGEFERTKRGPGPAGASIRPFPEFLVKTDQERLQNNVKLIANLGPDRLFTTQIKYDGQSVQWFYYAGNKLDFKPNPSLLAEDAKMFEETVKSLRVSKSGMCSRNFQVLLEYDKPVESRDSANNKFRVVNDKYAILDKLKMYCTTHDRSLSLQTELYGPGINGNRHRVNHLDIVVFDIYDIDKREYLPYAEVEAITKELDLPTAHVVSRDAPIVNISVDDWVALASSQVYPKTDSKTPPLAEGIVVKTSDSKYPYVSFKVISPAYLLKHGL